MQKAQLKACSHPYLFNGMETEPFEEGEHLIQESGKLIIMDILLEKLHGQATFCRIIYNCDGILMSVLIAQ